MSQEIIIKNIEGLSENQIRDLVNKGGKFVIYTYCISIVIMTFKRSSNIHFIKPGNSAIAPGLGLLFVSLILGWWGLPWAEFMENVTPREQYELLELQRVSGFVDRAKGLGRPTKKDRRDLDQFAEDLPEGMDLFDWDDDWD